MNTILRAPKLLRAAVAASLALSAFAACAGSAEEDANKRLVLAFHERVLNGKDADAAPQYVAEHYVQHNPRVPDGLDALQRFVRGLRQSAPESRSSVKRVVAEGDLVVLHSHLQRSKDDRGMALVDIFRIENGKLVEHWDVMQPVPEGGGNANGMF